MVSIEDPFDQDDWDGYRPFTAAVGEKAWDFRHTLESNEANKNSVTFWVGADRWG